PPSFSLFSFLRSAPHPDLPSFPTRRSSDLCHGAELPPDAVDEIIDGLPGLRRIRRFQLTHVLRQSRQALETRMIVEEIGDRRGGDRKSTRLNSSHDQISYAVFCLKKKKKKK